MTTLAWSIQTHILWYPFPVDHVPRVSSHGLVLVRVAQFNPRSVYQEGIVQNGEVVVQETHDRGLRHPVRLALVQVSFLVVGHLVRGDEERLPMTPLSQSLDSGKDF